ncbi:DUF1349 domain-containing protein [bacterium]|nr:DUF1349 domain-containing protein [bacterium]
MIGRWSLTALALVAVAAVAGPAAAQFAPDDFNGCAIDPVWTFFDPLSDGGAVGLQGGYSDDAVLTISVPGGAPHEIWQTNVDAPRLMQPVTDTDFTAEVKFNSFLDVAESQEGIVVYQDSSNWLRLEIYRDGAGEARLAALGGPTTVFADAAVPGGNSGPLYLRVVRTGDSWTLSWSLDGTAWTVGAGPFTYAFAPSEVGVYAGNRGATPLAHTIEVDYFTNTAGAPVDEDVERAPLDVTIVGTGLVQKALDLASYACAQVETLTAVDQPGWAFSGWTGDVVSTQNPLPVTMSGPAAITANFAVIPQHDLTVTLVGGGAYQLDPPGGTYNEGTVVTVTAVDTPGWAFNSWSGDLTGTTNPQTVTMAADRFVTATFDSIITYTLTTDPGPAGGAIVLNPAGGVYNAGAAVTVTAVPDLGYAFDGFTGDLTGTTNPQVLTMDADKSVATTFTALPPRLLTVNVTGQGAVAIDPDQPSYLSGTPVALTATADPGWYFAGWTGDHTGIAPADTVIMDQDRTIEAVFTLIPPIVFDDDFNGCDLDPVWTVVDPYGDGGTAALVNAYTDSAAVAISVPGGSEHEIWNGFLGATHILQPSPNIDFVLETKFDSNLPHVFDQEGILIKQDDTTWIRAEFFRDSLGLLSVAVDRGPNLSTHSEYLPNGVEGPLWMRLERSGNYFTQSWSSDGVTWNLAGTPFAYDMTVTATGLFAGNRGANPQAHTVLVDYISSAYGPPAGEDVDTNPLTVSVVGGGLVQRALDLPSYACAQVETLTAVDQPGWAFSGWSGDVSGTQNPIAVTVDPGTTVTATFVAVPTWNLDLTLVGTGVVTLDPPGGVYNTGTVVTLAAVDQPGWAFSGWSGDLTGATTPTTLTMDADKAVTATFAAVVVHTVTVAALPGAGGSVVLDPPGGSYNAGTQVTVTAVPAVGYGFDAWSGDLAGSVNPQVVTVDGDKTINAGFAPLAEYILTVNTTGQGSVVADPVQTTYYDGTPVALTATPDAGWVFSGWSGDLTGTANPDTVLMDDNRVVTATFTQIPSVVFADDFNGCALDPIWTVVDPLSDGGTAITVNPFSGDAHAAISVPAGAEHEIWNGAINAPHILQTAVDTDFQIEVKFDSDLAAAWSQEGILVRQDESTWIRSEFYRDAGLNLHAALVFGPDIPDLDLALPGTVAAPLWMRLSRTGDTFIQSWSDDGLTWNQTGAPFDYAMVVGGIGAYAGNRSGSAPAHTVLVDYFNNEFGAPVGEDQGLASLDVTVVGGGLVTRDIDLPSYGCGQVVTLTAVDQPGWAFAGWSGDVTSTQNPLPVTMDGATAVTATFVVVPQFTLTTDALPVTDGSVTLDPPGGTYNQGTVVTLTAVPATGFSFDAWSGDLTGSVNPETLVMDGNKSVTAGFLPLPSYGIGINVAEGGIVQLSPDQPSYLAGTEVVLQAIPSMGWQFVGWSGDLTGTANPDTIIVDADKLITATFAPITPLLVSDDFNSCTLDPAWIAVDPAADGATFTMVDTWTDAAALEISVPAGNVHEIWTGSFDAPRIMQPVTDMDFHVEARFDSNLPAQESQQGFLFWQDTGTWLRAGFYRNPANDLRAEIVTGPGNDVFDVGLPGGSVAPLYLRVSRYGDTFELSWSTDGTMWNLYPGGAVTYPMNMASAGVFAGNRGLTPPAHTVRIDYVSGMPQAPAGEDAALNALTVNVVGAGAVTRAPDLPSYGCGELVQLTAVPDPGFAFAGWSGAVSGTTNPIDVVMDGPDAVTATFVAATGAIIAADTGGVTGLSTANTCATAIPVTITRDTAENLRAFSVTVELAGLDLCNGTASIAEGTYLSAAGTTLFDVVDNLDGTWQVDGTILGTPCGATAATGVLFTLDVTNTIADGTGTITLTGLDVRDCDGLALTAVAGTPATIVIDTTAPADVTAPVVSPVLSGNAAGAVTGLNVAWTAAADPTAVETRVYRRGFGSYPEFDDAGGAVPPLPADPEAEGWSLAGSVAAPGAALADLPPVRDLWYYCLVSVDALGNRSAGLVAGGELNYLLGDVRDPGNAGADGDNVVDAADISRLGAGYGTIAGDGLYDPVLDVGPTTDASVHGRPLTDNQINFEDLILFSLNFGLDATAPAALLAQPGFPVASVPAPAAWNGVAYAVPTLPAIGETFVVEFVMSADGRVQALQLPLSWNRDAVELVGFAGGDLLADQGGQSLVLSASAGVIDAALVGRRSSGISGTGTLVRATFRVIGAGSADLALGPIVARDADNAPVTVSSDGASAVGEDMVPRVSSLGTNYPNPFNPMTTIAFDVAKGGRVRLAIYSVDGRLVRTLADEQLAAGRYERVWRGQDDAGRPVASGTYLYRLEGPGFAQTRRMLLLK